MRRLWSDLGPIKIVVNYALLVCNIFGPICWQILCLERKDGVFNRLIVKDVDVKEAVFLHFKHLFFKGFLRSIAHFNKNLSRLRLFFYVAKFALFRCHVRISWDLFKLSVTFPQKTEYHRKVLKNFHKRVEFAIDSALNDLSLHQWPLLIFDIFSGDAFQTLHQDLL